MPKERVRLTAAIKVATDYLHHNRSTTSAQAVTSQNSTIANDADVDTSSMTSSLSSCDVIQCDLTAAQMGHDMSASQTNLIVNYLPQTLTQEDMKSLFSSVGEMESCRLIRDKSTGQSLGYGFVKYKTVESANKAIATLNGLRIQNKTIKVSVARPSSDCIKGANLYVSGLPKHATSQDLLNWFAPCGQIITARVLSDPLSGLTRGVGFVRFNLKSEAETAIKLLSGTVPNGATEPISVKFANQPTVAKTMVPTASAAAAAVCRLGLVPAHGQPAVGTLLLTPHNQLLPTPSTVQPRLANLTQLPPVASPAGYATMSAVDPMLMTPQFGGGGGASGVTVVVNNMPNDLDEAGLCRLFQCFGSSLQSACILATQPPVGLVTMSNYYDALSAITALNGLAVNGSVLQLTLSPVAAPSTTGNTALTSIPAASAATVNTAGLRYLIPTAAAAATTRQLIPLTII